MENKYTIRVAAELTGLSTLLIRAWENRYNVVKPERTEGNHRLYNSDDIKKLKLLSHAVNNGAQIGSIAHLKIEELENLTNDVEEESSYIDLCKQALRNLDYRSLEETIYRADIHLGNIQIIDKVIVPLMIDIGDGWNKGEWRIFHEHLLSAVIRTYLGNKLSSTEREDASMTAIVTTPVSQKHDLGALAIALAAASTGFKILYLGPETPADEIIRVAEESHSDIIMLSIVFPSSVYTVKQEVSFLEKYLPENCSLIIGGSSAKKYTEKEKHIAPSTLEDFRSWLLNFKNLK